MAVNLTTLLIGRPRAKEDVNKNIL